MEHETCELCGGSLDCFEGELYCLDCTRYDAIRDLDRATDEALAVMAIIHPPDPRPVDMVGDQPPF